MEKECLSNLLDLLKRYSSIYRGIYLPSRVSQIAAEPGSEILRESLADHVGALPIVATFLHPYLAQGDVDISKVLLMLAIHDIGETVTGDILTVKRQKTDVEVSEEQRVALSQLDPEYHLIFEEFESSGSLEAKFAHSVDKISPNLYELIVDKELAQDRHAYFGFDIIEVVEKDRGLMEWNDFLVNFYDELVQQIKKRFG